LRFLLVLLVVAPLSGCAADFHAPAPKTVASPWLNARAVELSTGPQAEVRVRLLTAGRPGVRLRNALLARGATPPCTSDKTFVSFSRDGVPIEKGPVAVGGTHELEIVFDDDPPFGRLEADGAVDLPIESDDGHGCVRVPLLGGASAPEWENVDAPRFAMGAEIESFPIAYRDPAGVSPIGGAGFWFGVEDAKHRLFLLQSAAFTSNPTSEASGHLGFTLGGNRTLALLGPVSAKLSAGYQGDIYFAREPFEQRATRHFLHGPVVTPALSIPLSQGPYPPTARGGTLHLELGLPTLLWFRAPDAGGPTVAGGVTFGCYGVF